MHEMLLLQTSYSPKQRLVFFPSGHERNRFMDHIKSSRMDDEFADIHFEDEKFTTKYKNVKSIVYPASRLRGKEDTPLFNIEVIFEDSFSVIIPVVGRKRASNSFRKLKQFQSISSKDTWIQVKQDEIHSAILKWNVNIAEIYCTESEDQ